MDSLTQITLGAACGAAGFQKHLGRRAILWGGVLGLLPDLDIVVGFQDRWLSLVHHRGYSHSLIILPLVTPLIAWLGWRVLGQRKHYALWLAVTFLALFTHPLLDWSTSYGTMLLLPFTNARFANDSIAIIDPIYTIPLLAGLLYALFAKNHPERAARVIQVLLVLTTLYIGVGQVQMQRAKAIATQQLAQRGVEPVEIRAMPTIFNIMAWRIAAREADRTIYTGALSLVAPNDIVFERFDWPEDERVEIALASARGHIVNWFAQDMLSAHVVELGDGTTAIDFIDQRYGSLTAPRRGGFFRTRAVLNRENKVIAFDRLPRQRMYTSPRAELAALWHFIRTGERPRG